MSPVHTCCTERTGGTLVIASITDVKWHSNNMRSDAPSQGVPFVTYPAVDVTQCRHAGAVPLSKGLAHGSGPGVLCITATAVTVNRFALSFPGVVLPAVPVLVPQL